MSKRLRLESLRETPLPSSPGSPTLNLTLVPSPKRDDLNLTPVPFPQPQPPALLRAPTLDLTPSPLPEDPDCDGEEEEKSKEEEKSNVDCDVGSDVEEEEKSSDIKEEVKSKEEPLRSQDWAPQEGEFSSVEEVERERRKVVATRKWQELELRTARTVRALKPVDKDKTNLFLSFEPGALITEIRPASWVEDDRFRWLEGTLEGRVGLVLECWVE